MGLLVNESRSEEYLNGVGNVYYSSLAVWLIRTLLWTLRYFSNSSTLCILIARSFVFCDTSSFCSPCS
jgi:hypothetical protein